ncbi:MAG: hypothetical protein AAF215_31530 [Cyanobacteria bacterium P01_A01_bin.123]
MAGVFEALESLRPGARFNCADTLESIEWLDPEHGQPTDEEILDEIERLSELAKTPAPEWAASYRYLLTTPVQARITELADIVAPVARARGDVAVALLAPVDDATKQASLTAALESLNSALNDVNQGLDANEKAILSNWNANYSLGLELSFLS